MNPTMVIKVKYGETLRRFHALILTCKYGLDMYGLGKKICSLFNLPSDSDLKMTYIDEDGDVVTLVDDDDLDDILEQKLKFLRIDVELSNKVACDALTELHSKSRGEENLYLCPMCCTKRGTENDPVRTTYQSSCRKKLPSSRLAYNENPGLDPGELEQNGCLISNDCMRTPFLASRVENGEEASSREANLLDKLPKNCQRFPATPAAGTSTGSHPVALDKNLPAVSVGAPPFFKNGSDRRIMEIRLRELEEKRLRRIGKIRDVLCNDYYLTCSVASFDEGKWDAALHDLEELGFRDMPMVETLLKKNDGNIRRTVLGLLSPRLGGGLDGDSFD